MMQLLVLVMLFTSSVLMAFAWLGHIRFRSRGFWLALIVSWFLVFPEYMLNIVAFRMGSDYFSPSEMAAFNLSSGVVCVALVSHFFLGERLSRHQTLGFILMAFAVGLIVY